LHPGIKLHVDAVPSLNWEQVKVLTVTQAPALAPV